MKVLIYSLLFLVVSSCSSSNVLNKEKGNSSAYLIQKIESVNSWYVIYAAKKGNLYKIISGERENQNGKCNKIVIGQYYNFVLHSKRDNPPYIGKVKLQPINYLDIRCYAYDKETEICIEPEKGINDLYYTDNLEGLCFHPLARPLKKGNNK